MNRPLNNPVLKSMNYESSRGILSVEFKRNGQIRRYECASELAYKLFYCKTATEELKVYNEVKKQCNVADVQNPK